MQVQYFSAMESILMNDYYTNEPANRILFFPENKQTPRRNAPGPHFILNLHVAVFLKN